MFILAVLFITALEITLGVLLNDIQALQLIVNFLVFPLFFLSGSSLSLTLLLLVLGLIVAVNPLLYELDGLRGTLIAFLFMELLWT